MPIVIILPELLKLNKIYVLVSDFSNLSKIIPENFAPSKNFWKSFARNFRTKIDQTYFHKIPRKPSKTRFVEVLKCHKL